MATRYNFFGGLVTDGMILNFDAAKSESYPAGGTAWLDISGNSNNGTIVNGPQFTGTGKQAAFVFDGNNDYVVFPTNKMPSGNSPITYNAWSNWKGNGVNANDFIVGYGNDIGANIVPLMIIGPTGQMIFEFGSNSGVAATPFGITSGTWLHSCGVYNKSTSMIYLNGTPSATKAYSSANIGPSGSNGLNGAIGALFSVYGNVGTSGPQRYGTFNGSIAQVQIYNKALSQFEVWQNFNSYKSRYGIPDIVTNGLVMNLDAGNPYSYYSPTSGTTWVDVSGNGNNGTLTNGVTYSNGTMVFDGVDDYATCGATAGNFGTSNFTINFFFKTSQAVAPRTFIAKSIGDNPTSNYGWLVNNGSDSSNLGFAIASVNGSWGNTGSYSIQTSGIAINDGNWKMATIVGDRTQANVTIYINGVSRSLQGYVGAASFSTVGSVSNNLQLTVGAESDPGPSLFPINGSISAVQIYNRALSSSEVLQNYNSLKGRYGL